MTKMTIKQLAVAILRALHAAKPSGAGFGSLVLGRSVGEGDIDRTDAAVQILIERRYVQAMGFDPHDGRIICITSAGMVAAEE